MFLVSKFSLLFVIYYYRVLGSLILKTTAKTTPKSILFLAAFFPENAGYNWRVKKWAEELEKKGFKVDIESATNKHEFYSLTNGDRSLFLIRFLKRRFWQVVHSKKYETVIVRRELLLYNDYGNLFLDRLLLKIHPNAILDFDDDIAYAKNEPREINRFYGKLLTENGRKFTESLNLYQQFWVGSNYLKDYVHKINPMARIEVLPTCVDYDKFEPKKYNLKKEEIVFGWIGGDHNQFLLENIIESLNKVSKLHSISLLVISGKEYLNNKAIFPIKNIQWSLETEVENIKKIDIGLMPLNNTREDQGKAGFKLIQYMGLGIIPIASSITVNEVIVNDNVNGYLVKGNNWGQTLNKVLLNRLGFQRIGYEARNTINQHYSFKKNIDLITKFIKK